MLTSATVQRSLAALLVVLLAVIGVVLLTSSGRTSGSTATAAQTGSSRFDGSTLPPGLRAHDFALSDQNGHRISMAQYSGRVRVLTFIYSTCTNTCPFMVEQIKGALNLLPGGGRDVAVIGVSTLPSADTPASRRRFLAKHQMTGRMEYLNGSHAAMEQVWHEYGIQPEAGGLGHSSYVFLIDPQGHEVVGDAADGALTPETLAHDLRVLLRERA